MDLIKLLLSPSPSPSSSPMGVEENGTFLNQTEDEDDFRYRIYYVVEICSNKSSTVLVC